MSKYCTHACQREDWSSHRLVCKSCGEAREMAVYAEAKAEAAEAKAELSRLRLRLRLTEAKAEMHRPR